MMSDAIREIKIELFEAQNEIIRLQSEVIDEMLKLLSMHLEPQELNSLPAIEKINKAAMIRREHEL